MREVVSIATLFLLLAAAGMEAEPAKASKTCHGGDIAALLFPGC